MPRTEPGRGRGWGIAEGSLLVLVATVGLLAGLGGPELWGRREQRAAAEAVDTVRHGHWLVGSIQGRPRLEKPPLPRWVGAALIGLTGRADEAIVRLPGAFAGLALVGLVVAWGRALGGRGLGLVAGFALVATPFFLVEMRQAGVDGPLALCVGLALGSACRRWGLEDAGGEFDHPGGVGWAWAFHLSVGLGFLCKGPVVFLWVVVPIVGFLLSRRRLGIGCRLLTTAPGLIVLAALVGIWPVLVASRYPMAWGVWTLEVGQKAGGLGVEHGQARGSILTEALGVSLPWTPWLLAALVGPIRRWWDQRQDQVGGSEPMPALLALAWWWAFAPLAVIGAWDVGKANYLLPAVPAWAILAGTGWVRLAGRARAEVSAWAVRLTLQAVWSGLLASAVVVPVAIHALAPEWLGWAIAAGLALGVAAIAAAGFWHLGRDAASLGALTLGLVVVAALGFGLVAPAANATRGHRQLAGELARRLPGRVPAWFFDDLDEGVWFYGPNLDLRPVPPLVSEAPVTNRGHALRTSVAPRQTRAEVARGRAVAAARQIAAWAETTGPGAHLLIRAKLLDHLAADLPPGLVPVYREIGVERNAVVLLRVQPLTDLATRPPAPVR